MNGTRSNRWALILLLGGLGIAYSQETQPGFGQEIEVKRDMGAFPSGDYEVVKIHRSQSTTDINGRKTRSPTSQQDLCLGMKFDGPAQVESGRGTLSDMTFTVRSVHIQLEEGDQKYVYDSDGTPEEQTPVLASQFKYLVGASSCASISGRSIVRPFSGLDQAWDNFGRKHPEMAEAVKGNKQYFGDTMLVGILTASDSYLRLASLFPALVEETSARPQPDLPTRILLKVGDTWKVAKTMLGLERQPTKVTIQCKLIAVKGGYATITATWQINKMAMDPDPSSATTRGVDEKGSVELALHAASGMVTELKSVVARVDQVATTDASGRIRQVTTRTEETRSFSIRPKSAGEPAQASSKEIARALLGAYKTRDLAEMARYCTEGNREMMEELATQGVKHPRYKSLFRGWRWETVQRWDGEIGEVRYPSATTAWASYLINEKDRRHSVVVLLLRDGKWSFEDLHDYDEERFLSASTTP